MRNHVEQLMAGDGPADYYQLVGKELLSADRDELLLAVRTLNRQLHGFQHHSAPSVGARARKLQLQLGEADRVFSNEDNKQTYDQELVERLVSEFVANSGNDPNAWRSSNVRRWLQHVRRVHVSQLDAVTAKILSARPQVQSAAVTPGVALTEEPGGQSRQQSFFPAGATPRKAKQSSARVSQPGSKKPQQKPRAKPPTQSKPPAVQRPPSLKSIERTSTTPDYSAKSTLRSNSTSAAQESDVGWTWVIVPAVLSALLVSLVAIVFFLPSEENGVRDDDSVVAGVSSEERNGSPDVDPSDDAPPNGGHEVSEEPTEGNLPAPEDTSSTSSAANQPDTPVDDGGSTSESPLRDSENPSDTESGNTSGTSSSDRTDSTNEQQHPRDPNVFDHGAPVVAVAWSHDGKLVATGGDDIAIRIWDVQSGKPVATLTDVHSNTIRALAFSSDDSYLASASDDGSVKVWDLSEMPAPTSVALKSNAPVGITAICWAAQRGQVIAGASSGELVSWTAASQRRNHRLEAGEPAGAVSAISSPSNRRRDSSMAVGHRGGTVIVWNASRRQVARVLFPVSARIWETWDWKKGKDLKALKSTTITPHLRTKCHDVSLANGLLAIANDDIELWDISGDKANIRLHSIPGWSNGQTDQLYHRVSWHPDGNYLLGTDGTGNLSVWDKSRWRLRWSFSNPARVHAAVWGPVFAKQSSSESDQSNQKTTKVYTIAVAGADGEARIVRIEESTLKGPPREPDFELARVMAKAEELLANGEWEALRRAANLLSMYRLPIEATNRLNAFEQKLRQEAKARVETIEDGDPPGDMDELAAHVIELQGAIDLDPVGPTGERARKLIEDAKVRKKPASPANDRSGGTSQLPIGGGRRTIYRTPVP